MNFLREGECQKKVIRGCTCAIYSELCIFDISLNFEGIFWG